MEKMSEQAVMVPELDRIDEAGHSGHGRVYAAAIVASAVFLLVMLVWPLTVSRFQTTTRFEISYESASGLDKSRLNQLVVTSLRDAMRAEAVADSIRRIEGAARLKSSLLRNPDIDTLSSAIRVNWREGRHANSIEYEINMTGSGTPDEIAFLNDLVVRINGELGSRIAGDRTAHVMNGFSDEVARFYDGTVEQFAQQVNMVMQRVESARTELAAVRNSLCEADMEEPAAAVPFARPDESKLDAELKRLLEVRNELLSRSGMTQWHPEVTAVQKQIEELQNRVTEGSASQAFSFPSNSQATVVRNRFVDEANRANNVPAANASHVQAPVSRQPAIAEVLKGIEEIDLNSPAEQLDALGEQIAVSRAAANEAVSRVQRQALENSDTWTPVKILDIAKASASTPIGGTPRGREWGWLMAIAGLAGIAVSVNYDPSRNIRRFRSSRQLETVLGLPVLGTVYTRPAAAGKSSLLKWTAARLVRMGEWTLLGGAVLLLIAAMINSQIAGAFLENPFHAVTNTVWILLSRSP
jgi:hypothetical protein